jgi:TonB family protein
MRVIASKLASSRELVATVQAQQATIDHLVVDVTDGLSNQDVSFILKAAAEKNIPVVGTSEGFVKAGAPVAVAIDPRNVGAEAGKLASQHAAGLFDPRRFRVLVNLVVAQRLGMTVAQDRGTVEANILTLDTDGSDLVKGAPGKALVDARPEVLKKSRLSFPAIAMSTGVRSAEVVLDVTVKSDGTVGEAKVVRGDPMFSTAAIDSVKEWQFKPASRAGAPVDGTVRLNLKFQR